MIKYNKFLYHKIINILKKSVNYFKTYGFITLIIKIFSKSRSLYLRYIYLHCKKKNNMFNYEDLNFQEVRTNNHIIQHNQSVDIIICVHNALNDIKKCLESVINHTTQPYSIIIIDDGSFEETKLFLEEFAQQNNATLIRNPKARGYTFAANQGLKVSKADYCVLLNSDTIVSPQWLDRMIQCAETDAQIGMVGPLSNTASWQSVPEVEANGDWAGNDLPPHITIYDMAKLITKYSSKIYPQIPFLNGFCLLIKRQLINDIGYFDELTFGKGYGEENDYCLRAQKAGWKLVVSDDVYIYHAQSRSYTDERRKILSERAGELLKRKHSDFLVDFGVDLCYNHLALEGIRQNVKVIFERERLLQKGSQQWGGKKILFILPANGVCGGANVIFQEAEAMIRMGLNVEILNLEENKENFQKETITNMVPVIFSKIDDIKRYAPNYDAIIATANYTVAWLTGLNRQNNTPILGYYIQDFEPYFYKKGSREYNVAWESYTMIPNIIRFTKTEWNKNEIKKNIGVDTHIIGPSVNIDLFKVRKKNISNNSRIVISAMVRPSSPRRGAKLTMEILKKIWEKHKDIIEIIIFGCSDEEIFISNLEYNFPYKNMGVLNPERLAGLFSIVDIFVDFSVFQAMGLTALEAMASGIAVIVPKNGGTNSYAINNKNALIVDTNSQEECFKALNMLVTNESSRIQIAKNAIRDATNFFPEKAAYNILELLFNLKYEQYD